jgi:hypothetical protein
LNAGTFQGDRDHIIVGAGSAGCVGSRRRAAERAARENAGRSAEKERSPARLAVKRRVLQHRRRQGAERTGRKAGGSDLIHASWPLACIVVAGTCASSQGRAPEQAGGRLYLMTQHGWGEVDLALAFAFGTLAGLLSQALIDVLVDAMRAKRALLAGALLLVTLAAFTVVLAPGFWPVALAGVIGALANSTVGTMLAAVSLGVVGHARFARRAARNEALFHAGSAAVYVAILLSAPFYGVAIAFWLLAAAAVASLAAVFAIRQHAIDYDVARGFTHGAINSAVAEQRASSWAAMLANRALLVFALCGALFHLANASTLGLVVQRASRMDPASAAQLAAACMIAAQIVMVATA